MRHLSEEIHDETLTVSSLHNTPQKDAGVSQAAGVDPGKSTNKPNRTANESE